MHRSHLAITTLAILLATATPQSTHAQIVSDVSGKIELRLNAVRYGTPQDNPDVIESFTIGLEDAHPVLDRSNATSASGLSKVDYEYLPLGPAEAQFNIYTFSDSRERDYGNGGHALINFDITIPAPFSYRFEANANTSTLRYEVSFNDVSAYAESYDTIYGGTFPLHHFYEDGAIVYTSGWHPYIDQGILPAGTYNVSVLALSATHGRYGVGLGSQGSASLLIQLLGDTDLDGTVGTQDLNNVLNAWNQTTPAGDPLIADLNNDGFIGIADLNQILAAWNADVRPQATTSSVPEPTTIAMLTTLLLTLTTKTTRRPQQGQRHLYT